MSNINEALKLMGIGMATVFVALLLIIYFCKALIWFINKYAPEETNTRGRGAVEIPSKVVAAITTAVGIASNGKAKIVKIENKNN